MIDLDIQYDVLIAKDNSYRAVRFARLEVPPAVIPAASHAHPKIWDMTTTSNVLIFYFYNPATSLKHHNMHKKTIQY
jgi:hypothetical protein